MLAAQGGALAIALTTSRTRPIDLLLTDVIMTGMNGALLQDALRQQRPNLKVLFMSGYSGDVISTQGMLEQGTHFIQKPFTMLSLAKP